MTTRQTHPATRRHHPPRGTITIHPSGLPRQRTASPLRRRARSDPAFHPLAARNARATWPVDHLADSPSHSPGTRRSPAGSRERAGERRERAHQPTSRIRCPVGTLPRHTTFSSPNTCV
ncbi:MAG: hypothetical protein U1U88_002031 [Lawsonella clevelandensis]